jgi:hypothetical protein
MAEQTERKMQYGEIEIGGIDGRAAFAWTETWEDNGLRALTFRTVIPYDTITYIVEFHTTDPRFKNRPDSIRGIVSTFAIGRTEWNTPLLALGLGVSLLVLGAVASRVRSGPYPNSRHIKLITLPVEADEVDSEEACVPEVECSD